MNKCLLSLLFLSLSLPRLFSQSTLQIGQTQLYVDSLYSQADIPWELLWGPDNTLWFSERRGRVYSLDPETRALKLLLNIEQEVAQQAESGLLGMALHPDFSQNPELFLAYTYRTSNNDFFERLVRYQYSNDSLVNPTILLDSIGAAGIHNGARLLFLPDGSLLMSTGDRGSTATSQDTANLNGKILRIMPDGTIPSDNPFAGSPVYALGLRNVQGMTLHPNGKVYISEHGPTTDDEFQILEAGRNYGWPAVTGFCDSPAEQSFCQSHNVLEPLLAWTPTIAPSDLIYYVQGIVPEWEGKLLMTELKTGVLRSIELNSTGDSVLSQEPFINFQFGRLRDICQGPDGAIYLASNGFSWSNSNPGTHCIIRLSPWLLSQNLYKKQQALARVYPNPAQGAYTIELAENMRGHWLLFDIFGRPVQQGLIAGQTAIRCETQGLASGCYILQIEKEDGQREQHKLIIQNK